MLKLHRLTILSLLAFIGCAAYTPPPLTPDHPAHPAGMAASISAPSTTLAYSPSDMPSPQPASHMAQAQMPAGMQHGMHDTHPSQKESQQTVMGKGKVIAVVPSSNQLVVDHEAIEGFMDAMTMGYRVEPPSLLEGLNSGDDILFSVDPQKKAIVQIEKMKK